MGHRVNHDRKHKSSQDLFQFVYELRSKFVWLADKWPKRRGVNLIIPPVQQKNLRTLVTLYRRFSAGQRWHADSEIVLVKDFADWLINKACELTGQQPRTWNFDPELFIDKGGPASNGQHSQPVIAS